MAPVKTTVDIADSVLREARKVAAREGTTVRALIEEGLRRVVADKRRKRAFRLRLVTAGGRGLRPELREASWDEVHDLSYERIS
jgi:squalene cyclase